MLSSTFQKTIKGDEKISFLNSTLAKYYFSYFAASKDVVFMFKWQKKVSLLCRFPPAVALSADKSTQCRHHSHSTANHCLLCRPKSKDQKRVLVFYQERQREDEAGLTQSFVSLMHCLSGETADFHLG